MLNVTRNHISWKALIAGLVFTGVFATTSTATPPEDSFARGGVTPAMTAEWWQWVLSIPGSVHPLYTEKVYDEDGKVISVDYHSEYCMVGQHGPVWFLGGSFKVVDIFPDDAQLQSAAEDFSTDAPDFDIVRKCEIPLGKAILMPVINTQCDTAEEIFLENLTGQESLEESIDYLRLCVDTVADAIERTEAFFGQKGDLRPLKAQRVRTPLPFSITYSPDNVVKDNFDPPFENPDPNPSLSVADGYWVLVKPLRTGEYILITDGEVPAFEFSLRIKYILDIVGPEDQ